MYKWYGHVLSMEDSRWPKIIMYCSQGGREDEDDPSIVGKEN